MTDDYGIDFEAGVMDGDETPAADLPNLFSVDYYRGKVREFQTTLDALDVSYAQIIELGFIAYATEDAQTIADYDAIRNDFDSKLSEFRAVTTAIQLASDGLNAVGVNFPRPNMPMGLAAVPLVPLAAAAAAVAAAVVLINWANGFFVVVRNYVSRMQHIDAIALLPEPERAAALQDLRNIDAKIEQAQIAVSNSPMSTLMNAGKWIVVGAIAFFGYKLLKDMNHGDR